MNEESYSIRSNEILSRAECLSLRNFIRSRTPDPDTLNEVFQETYLRLLDADRKCQLANPLFYAFVVSRRLIAKRGVRGTACLTEAIEQTRDPAPLADEIYSDRQKLRHLSDAIERLPAMRREAFICRRIRDLPSKAVAAHMGISVNAVDKHVSRAMQCLSKEMTIFS